MSETVVFNSVKQMMRQQLAEEWLDCERHINHTDDSDRLTEAYERQYEIEIEQGFQSRVFRAEQSNEENRTGA